MIVDKDIGAVADWWFEDRRSIVSPTSRSELHQLLKMCQSVAEVLEFYQLLKPYKVIFSGWLSSDSDNNSLVRVEEPDVTVTILNVPKTKSILTCCNETLDQLEKNRSFLYPIDVEILGTGIILDADGQECELPNVTWLLGKTLDAHIVDVCTQSDAWLPYNLKAEPQFAVGERNAPRLEAALQEIQKQLGFFPVTDSHSDYAVIQGFKLTNHTDIDGEVFQVYN